MKAKKIIKTTETIELEIAEITLLSKEEYEAAKEYIPAVNAWWWLRSPIANLSMSAGIVDYDGWVFNFLVDDYNGARPALKIRNLESVNLEIKDQIQLAGYTWTVIADSIILCDQIVGTTTFREDWQSPDANVYEKSDIKAWLEDWAKEEGIRSMSNDSNSSD